MCYELTEEPNNAMRAFCPTPTWGGWYVSIIPRYRLSTLPRQYARRMTSDSNFIRPVPETRL